MSRGPKQGALIARLVQEAETRQAQFAHFANTRPPSVSTTKAIATSAYYSRLASHLKDALRVAEGGIW